MNKICVLLYCINKRYIGTSFKEKIELWGGLSLTSIPIDSIFKPQSIVGYFMGCLAGIIVGQWLGGFQDLELDL